MTSSLSRYSLYFSELRVSRCSASCFAGPSSPKSQTRKNGPAKKAVAKAISAGVLRLMLLCSGAYSFNAQKNMLILGYMFPHLCLRLLTCQVPYRITCMLASAFLDEHEESGSGRLKSHNLLSDMRVLRNHGHESHVADMHGLYDCEISYVDIPGSARFFVRKTMWECCPLWRG